MAKALNVLWSTRLAGSAPWSVAFENRGQNRTTLRRLYTLRLGPSH